MIDVWFREVESLYDLHRGRRVLEDKTGPALIHDLARFDSNMIGGPSYRTDASDGVSRVTGGMPGVHQIVEIEGADKGETTFSRAHATAIAGKWIYMFSSTDAAGNGMTLEHELFADAGEVQLVDLVANKGKDDRKPSGTKRRALQVEVRSIARPSRSIWFLLAPYPIAWARLVQMVASGPQLASRCQRLFDEFWTDGLDGTTPKPFSELKEQLRSNKSMGFVLYLLDPLAEGVRRATYYNLFHDAWQQAASKLAGDDEYRLAKRVHSLPAHYANSVWHKLGPYLHNAEKNTRPLLAIASARLEDLLWWIGRLRCRTDSSYGTVDGRPLISDTWYMGKKDKLAASLERKSDRSRYNAFSEMVLDYGHPDTDDRVAIDVAYIVSMVNARLGGLPDGQTFLAKIMRVAIEGKLPVADGGASMLFEAKRKSSTTAAEIGSVLLERYANAWVAAYRSDSLPRLIAFAKKRLALELRQRYSHEVGRAMASIERRIANKADKGGIERLGRHYHVEVDPASARALGLAKPALDRLAVGFEVFNLALSVQALREEKDPWAAIELLGSTIDAYAAISKIYPKLERVQFSIGKTKVAFEIASKLALLSSAIDVLLAAREAVNATDATVKTGQVMRTIGAYLTLGGAIFRATPAGAVMTVVGLALQALGSAIASGTDDLKLFLVASRWGDGVPVDAIMGISIDGKRIGYAGKLVDLRNDITAQHRALDWIMYKFEPSVRVFDGAGFGVPSQVFLRMNPPAGLGPDAKWTINVEVVDRDGGGLRKRWDHEPAAPVEAHVSLSANEEMAIVQHQVVRATTQPSMSAAWGKVRVRGTLELDVFGDGSSVVKRQIDQKLDLPF